MTDVASLAGRLSRVEEKISQLKRADRGRSVFGSESHRYVLNPTLDEKAIVEFERSNGVRLPLDYRCFVRFIGNGGTGPFYGLGRLEHGIYDDMDSRNPAFVLDLSKAFPYTEPWNLEEEAFDEDRSYEEDYFDNRHAQGLLRLCNYGCGVFINLVVNGAEYGNMWTDDRGSNMGIYPSKELGNDATLSFLDWYELWLDKSFQKLTV